MVLISPIIQPITLNPIEEENIDNLNIDSNKEPEPISHRYNIRQKGLNVYKSASLAYFNSLIREDINKEDLYALNTGFAIIKEQDKITLFKKDISNINIIKEPKSYKEAINLIYKEYWIKAI